MRTLTALLAAGLLLCGWNNQLVAQEAQPEAEVSSNDEIEAHAKPHDEPAPGGKGHDDKAHGGGDHAAGEHGHGVGHQGASSDPAEIKSDLAIFTFIIFLLLFGILYKFAWGPISAALDAREKSIQDNIAAAQRANEEGKSLLAQYEKKLADAQGEVKAIIEEARRDAEHTQQEILAKAKADAQAERDRSLREIEMATDQALKELAEKSTNLAVDLAGKIVQAQVKKSDHERLIGDALNRFSKN